MSYHDYEVTLFYRGARVEYRNRPAWGEGTIQRLNVPERTCVVRWSRADPSWESESEVHCDELERVSNA